MITEHPNAKVTQYQGPKLEKPYCTVSNPSILYDPDKDLFYINIRATNYKLEGKPKHCVPHNTDTNSYYTQNWIGTTKDPMIEPTDWKLVEENPSLHKVVETKTGRDNKYGLEDIRLVKWCGKLHISGCRRDFNDGGMGRIQLMELDNNYKEVRNYLWQGVCNDRNYVEKNHMPVLDKPYQYVASTNPTFVYKGDRNTNRIISIKGNTMLAGCNAMGCMRGSSQVVPYENQYVAITHQSFKAPDGQVNYVHFFVTWDKDFSNCHISDMFDFTYDPVSFCCGIAIKDDIAYISYSEMDASVKILRIPMTALYELL